MLWLDISYAKQISYRLTGYKEKGISPYLANFRCHICGDSSKNRNKRRGYFYELKDHLIFKCHNCNSSMSFSSFLKDFDPNLYNVYALDRFKSNSGNLQPEPEEVDILALLKKTPPETKKYIPSIVDGLKRVVDLPSTHPVRQYVENRCIPFHFHDKLYYAPKFFNWTLSHTDKFARVPKSEEHPRLVIPWYSEDNIVFAYTARSFGKEEPKYYKLVVDDTIPPFYGMERLNRREQSYVVEGPIDSMFIDNCVAVGTSSLYLYDDPDAIYIPDRDIRNKEVMKVVKKLVELNKKVCLLPNDLNGIIYKDINELIQAGVTKAEVMKMINDNTFSGLTLRMKFMTWSKV